MTAFQGKRCSEHVCEKHHGEVHHRCEEQIPENSSSLRCNAQPKTTVKALSQVWSNEKEAGKRQRCQGHKRGADQIPVTPPRLIHYGITVPWSAACAFRLTRRLPRG